MEITGGLHGFFWRNPQANNCNTFLINEDKKILIDPGHLQLFGHVQAGLSRLGLDITNIDVTVITHGHIDHMEALAAFAGKARIGMNIEAYNFIRDYMAQLKIPEPDFFLAQGDFKVGKTTLQVIPTPGHSPGSVSIYWPEKKALFTGDVLFSQSIGRTDLPGGSGRALKESIRNLEQLNAEFLCPGHGEPVAGKENVRRNFKLIERMWFGYLDSE